MRGLRSVTLNVEDEDEDEEPSSCPAASSSSVSQMCHVYVARMSCHVVLMLMLMPCHKNMAKWTRMRCTVRYGMENGDGARDTNNERKCSHEPAG